MDALCHRIYSCFYILYLVQTFGPEQQQQGTRCRSTSKRAKRLGETVSSILTSRSFKSPLRSCPPNYENTAISPWRGFANKTNIIYSSLATGRSANVGIHICI